MFVPCNWFGLNSTLLRYGVVPHFGGSSLRVIADGTSTIAQARSDCFAVTPGTTYNLRAWYLVSPPVTISQITYAATFYSLPGCDPMSSTTTPAGASTGPGSPLMIDGGWHPISGSTTAPNGAPFVAQSARLQLNFSCVLATCKTSADPGAGFDAVQYDDLIFATDVLAVSVQSLTARRSHQGVLVRWRTGTEADLLGFQIYRSSGHSWRRITPSLVGAKGSVSGASYRYLDKAAKRGVSYRYRIKALEQDGTATWFGPVRVS